MSSLFCYAMYGVLLWVWVSCYVMYGYAAMLCMVCSILCILYAARHFGMGMHARQGDSCDEMPMRAMPGASWEGAVPHNCDRVQHIWTKHACTSTQVACLRA